MTIDYSSFGGSISRMVAAEAVASARTSRLLHDSAQKQQIASLEQRNFERAYGNLMKSAAGWQSVAQSVASAAQSCVSAGQQIDAASQRMNQEPQIAQGFDTARSATGEERSEAIESLRETPFGDQTVGDRYSTEELEGLLDADDANGQSFARELYEGPHEPERKTIGEALRDAVQDLAPDATNDTLMREAEAANDRAGRHAELAEHADAFADRTVDDAAAHQRAIFEIDREFKETQRRAG